MEVKISELNNIIRTTGGLTNTNNYNVLPIVLSAIMLAVITWYFLSSISTVLVIPKSNKQLSNKKICDFN